MPALGPRPRNLAVQSAGEIQRRIRRQALILLVAFAGASLALFEFLPEAFVRQFAAGIGIGLLAALVVVFSYLLYAGARREAALSQTLSLFIASLPVGVMFTDAEGKVTYANPSIAALVTGDPKADMRGRPGIGFVVPEDRARIATELAKRRDGAVSTYEVRGLKSTGEVVTAVITATPFLQERKFDGSLAVIVDVSDVVEARARAARYRDLASFALDVVTHDLSNKMQAVVTQAALAGLALGKDEKRTRKAIEGAQASADQAGRLIREVKQIAQAEREQWPKRRMPVRELMDRAQQMAELPVPLSVGLTPEAEKAEVVASDLGALGLAKMVEYAAEGAAPDGAGVWLEAKVDGGGQVVLSVRGYAKPVSDADLALMLAPPAEIGKGGIAWRSGIKLALAGAIWQAKGWKAGARREGDGVVFEVTAGGAGP